MKEPELNEDPLALDDKSAPKHPKGLYVLFFSEMWERFGFYLLIGIFSLYMLDSFEHGGMGFSAAKKSDIYGTYIGLVYLTPFIGGLLADRILGYRKSIILGGLLMSAGYFCLSIHNDMAFYVALLLIILGNGFFKPNISTLVGNLYNDDRYKANKDAGYNIFYMGINIGAFACNFVAAYMRINYGWGWAFAAAGIGMLIGVVIFIAGTKHIKHADVLKPAQKEDMSMGKIFAYVLLPVFICGVIGFMVPQAVFGKTLFGTQSNDAFIIGCIPVIIFYISLWKRASVEDKNPIAALLSVFFCVIVFWAVFHQNGDALTVWAKDHTDREMPTAIANAAEKVKMAQVVTYNPDSVQGTYFEHMKPESRPAPGTSLRLYSTELYQSINGFWVVMLTPVMVGFWGFMRSRKKELSTPAKITLGLFITGLSTLVMVGAVSAVQGGDGKASSWWLIMSYCVITFGELCLSPMGLSLVSKLSPPRLTALMMGGWFLSTSVGNKLSGMLSGLWETFENKSHFFLMNFGLCLVATLMMLFLLKWLKKVMAEKNIH
jgi:POT family proton-dependent oligopeptide transporter